MVRKTSKRTSAKKALYRLGGYTAGAWGLAQIFQAASSLVRTSSALRTLDLSTYTMNQKSLVVSVVGSDLLSYIFGGLFGVLLLFVGYKMVKAK